MYSTTKPPKTTIKRNTSYEGETLEKKINRIVNNKEPIKDGAPIIYTDRKDGVKPEYDIRTDRWEEAISAMDMVTKSRLAQRKSGEKSPDLAKEAKEGMLKESGGTEPIQATSN